MRRLFFRFLGVLELAAAAALLVFAWELPGPVEVEEVSTRVEKVSRNASRQVRAYCAGRS